MTDQLRRPSTGTGWLSRARLPPAGSATEGYKLCTAGSLPPHLTRRKNGQVWAGGRAAGRPAGTGVLAVPPARPSRGGRLLPRRQGLLAPELPDAAHAGRRPPHELRAARRDGRLEGAAPVLLGLPPVPLAEELILSVPGGVLREEGTSDGS